ncbi:unnamed protein product [Chrysoparadoxa australica]
MVSLNLSFIIILLWGAEVCAFLGFKSSHPTAAPSPPVEAALDAPGMDQSSGPLEAFRSFLSIRTISGEGPLGSYKAASEWLQTYAQKELLLEAIIEEYVKDKPVVVIKWAGSDESLPCVVMNGHYDVVPVMEDEWEVPAFEAVLRDGRVYGRGTQDMKCVCIQYLEAVKRLVAAGVKPLRTVYLTFVPDEECGGTDGMAKFIESGQWEAMQPIGVAFDEGLANPENAFTAFYGERTPWWLLVKATGPTGHGSRFINDTAVSKLMKACNQALEYRAQQEAELNHTGGCSHASAKKLGDVTTVNLTVLKAGVSADEGETWALNVIPTEAEAGFDVRISPHMKPQEFEAIVNKWCEEEGVSWSWASWSSPLHEHYLTSIDRKENPWWGVFCDTMAEIGVEVVPEIFPAATDSRFLRQIGVSAIGFSPMRNTPILLHEHNEWLGVETFLEGIDVYVKLIEALCMAPAHETEK